MTPYAPPPALLLFGCLTSLLSRPSGNSCVDPVWSCEDQITSAEHAYAVVCTVPPTSLTPPPPTANVITADADGLVCVEFGDWGATAKLNIDCLRLATAAGAAPAPAAAAPAPTANTPAPASPQTPPSTISVADAKSPTATAADVKSPAPSATESLLATLAAALTIPPRDDKTPPITWIMVGYVPGSIDQLTIVATGDKELGFKEYVKSDGLNFIVHRIKHAKGYQRDFDHMYRTYYGLVQWQGMSVCHHCPAVPVLLLTTTPRCFPWAGPTVEVIAKALGAYHYNDFEKLVKTSLLRMGAFIQGSHYHVERVEDITIERVKKTMNLHDF